MRVCRNGDVISLRGDERPLVRRRAHMSESSGGETWWKYSSSSRKVIPSTGSIFVPSAGGGLRGFRERSQGATTQDRSSFPANLFTVSFAPVPIQTWTVCRAPSSSRGRVFSGARSPSIPTQATPVETRSGFSEPAQGARQAHTSPIYVEIAGRPAGSVEDAEYFLA